MKKAKREAAAQRRPAQSERKIRAFCVKRQAVWFGTRSASNGKCSKIASRRDPCRSEEQRHVAAPQSSLPVWTGKSEKMETYHGRHQGRPRRLHAAGPGGDTQVGHYGTSGPGRTRVHSVFSQRVSARLKGFRSLRTRYCCYLVNFMGLLYLAMACVLWRNLV